MQITYTDEGGYGSPRFECRTEEDGFRAIVNVPHFIDAGWKEGWHDAKVDWYVSHCDSTAEAKRYAEFQLEVCRLADLLDFAFAADAEEHKERERIAEEEQERKEQAYAEALKQRCQKLGQFYMQWCRVQREGHKSYATGELVASFNEETGEFYKRMYLKEKDGNHWDFDAARVAKFEVKDGGRYRQVKLKALPEA